MGWSYVTGGTLAPDAPSYVERQADKDLLASLEAGETCYVLNSRQMGKSSLCVRTIGRLKATGVRTAFLDLTKFGGRNLTAEQWYAALLSEIGRELGQRNEFLAHWRSNQELPPVQRLFGAITGLGLQDGSPLVVFVDEIDVTLSLPFSADEFFAAIRQCYVGRATDDKLKRLSFCLLGTATPADLIQDTRVSPFNIGKRVELSDFTESEAMPLASGLGDPALLKRVLYWTGGHPYLTQRLCQAVRDSGSKDVDKVCSDLFLTHAAKEGDDNLAFVRNRLLKSEADLPALLDLYRKMRAGKSVQDDETNPLCAILKLSGVAKVEAGSLKVRNRIYGHVFDQGWVESHMPDAEKRRQKEAYRKGLLRAAIVGAAVVGAIAILAIQAIRVGQEAEFARKQLDYQLYVAKMNNLRSFHEEGNASQMARVLDETRNSPYRGWEWGYWNGVRQSSNEEYDIDSKTQDPIHYAEFSQDGKQIMIPDSELGVAFLVDRASKTVIKRYRLSQDYGSVSQARNRWIAVDRNGTSSSWVIRDLVSGQRLCEIAQDSHFTQRLDSDENTGLKMQSSLGKSRLIDPLTGKILWEIAPRSGKAARICSVSQDGQRVAVHDQLGNRTISVRVLDQSNQVIDQFLTLEWQFQSKLSPSGKLLLHARQGRLIVRDVDKQRNVLTVDLDRCTSASVDRTGHFLVSLHEGGRVIVRSIPAGTVVARYSETNYVDLSPSTNEMLLCSSKVRVVPLVPAGEKKLMGTVSRGAKNRIVLSSKLTNSYEFRADPSLQLIGGPFPGAFIISSEGSLKTTLERTGANPIWVLRDAESGQEMLRSKEGRFLVAASQSGDKFVTLSSDMTTVASYRRGSSISLWSQKYLAGVNTISLASDGSRALVLFDDEIVVKDASSGIDQKTLKVQGMCRSGFIGLSSDFWISNANKLELFDGKSLECKQTLYMEAPYVYALDRSPDYSRLVTTDSQGGVSIWDAKTLKRLSRIQVSSKYIDSIMFTRDGSKILASGTDGSVIVLESNETDSVTLLKLPATSTQRMKE